MIEEFYNEVVRALNERASAQKEAAYQYSALREPDNARDAAIAAQSFEQARQRISDIFRKYKESD